MRWLGVLVLACACGDNITIPPDPGSLVAVRVSSTVGVLLDEFSGTVRERAAMSLLTRDPSFWIERAKLQLRLTALRLVYRSLYYDEADAKNALPLPPESRWEIEVAVPARTTIDGHDVVAVKYTMTSTLLSDLASPGVSEPALAEIGGSTREDFTFPVDPTLLLQRTGFACMDEDEFPPDSVDSENAYEFYDDTCDVEDPLTQSCHLTTFPSESCVGAVARVIGAVASSVRYHRIAWSDELAAAARTDDITRTDAPDLKVITEGYQSLANHHVIYKYFAPTDCALNEQPACVGGPGWRRLLAFDSIDENVGGKDLTIGPVDYFNEGLGGDLIEHHVYAFSECHQHFHFQYYGDFGFGTGADQTVKKNGFCLETTGRLANHELSPLHTPYNCSNQGVAAGWVDLYAAGLTCNWVDITDVDTSGGPMTAPLVFQSNPNGFICEGEPVLTDDGSQAFEPSEFVSPNGDPVDRPRCTQAQGASDNDRGEVSATVPQAGGMLTTGCRDEQALGPLRNCGFGPVGAARTCTPGALKSITCSGASAMTPMVIRVCEASRALGAGVDCGFNTALANVTIEGTPTQIEVPCPEARDATETGGLFAVYAAPVFAPDGIANVTCN